MTLLKDTHQSRSTRWLRVVAGSAILVAVGLGGSPVAAQADPDAGSSDRAARLAAVQSSITDKPASSLAPGVQIRNRNTANMCLGIAGSAHHHGAPAIQWDCLPNERDQRWEFVHLGFGLHQIRNQNTANMCLGIAGGAHHHGAAAIQWECDVRTTDQYWEIIRTSTGTQIVSANTDNMCLGIRGSAHNHGAPAIQWDCLDNEPDQRWTIG